MAQKLPKTMFVKCDNCQPVSEEKGQEALKHWDFRVENNEDGYPYSIVRENTKLLNHFEKTEEWDGIQWYDQETKRLDLNAYFKSFGVSFCAVFWSTEGQKDYRWNAETGLEEPLNDEDKRFFAETKDFS